MRKDERAGLKKSIEARISDLKEDIASYAELTKPISPDSAIGRLTRMEAINSKSINEAALNKSKNTLIQLERALAKIDSDEYGLCRECDEPIPLARLMVLPETELCVQCAESVDQ